MTEIYLHFLCAHYGLYGNAPVCTIAHSRATNLQVQAEVAKRIAAAEDDKEKKRRAGRQRIVEERFKAREKKKREREDAIGAL